MPKTVTVTNVVINTFSVRRRVTEGVVRYIANGEVDFVAADGTVVYSKSYAKVLSNATIVNSLEAMIANFIAGVKVEEGI